VTTSLNGVVTTSAYTGNYSIRRMSLATTEVTTIAGQSFGTYLNAGPFTSDGLNLFLTSVSSNSVRKINLATHEISTIASTGIPAPWTRKAAEKLRPEGEGFGADHPGFGTLLFSLPERGDAAAAAKRY